MLSMDEGTHGRAQLQCVTVWAKQLRSQTVPSQRNTLLCKMRIMEGENFLPHDLAKSVSLRGKSARL